MKSWQKWVTGCVVFLLVLAGFIAFILPGIVRSQAIKKIEAATGRKTAIGAISLNPFTWGAEVKGFRLAEKDGGGAFVSFSSARVSISPASVWRAAPVISEARIVSPYVHLVRTAANTYNFSDLLEQKGAKKEAEKPARFSLNNIVISNGSVDFIDRALPQEKSHTVRRIEVGIPFISNIPYLADRYVLPGFSAIVNGAPLHAEGKLKPFTQARETSLDIELTNLDIPFYFAYVPGPVPVKFDSGRLTVKVEVGYRVASNATPELNVTGKVRLVDLFLRDRGGAPLVALKQADFDIRKGGVLSREFVLASASADGLEAYLSRDGTGEWNYARLMEKREPPATGDGNRPAESGQKKALVSIAETRLANGKFHFSDALPKGGFTLLLKDISLDMKEFSTAQGKKGSYTLSFASDRDEQGSFTGDFSVTPLAVHTSVDLKAIPLDAYYPYIAETLNGPLKGRLDFFSELTYADRLVTADKIAITMRGLGVDFGNREGVRFTTASLEGGRYSQKENLLEVASVAIGGGDIRISRDKEGILSPVTLLRKQDAQEKKKGGAAARSGGKPFRYLMRNFAAKGLSLSFTDHKVAGDPSFALKRANLNLKNLTWPERGPMPFSFGASYGDGALKVAGNVRPTPFALRGTMTLQRIPLTDFDSYLPEGLNIILADGTVDTRLSFNLAQGKEGLTGDYGGNLGVRNFHCLDAEHEEDLLKWESLQLDKISGTLAPFSLNVRDVSLNKYFAKVVVNKDGTLNLQGLKPPVKKEGTMAASPAAIPPSPTPATPAGQPTAAQPKKIRIDTVTLQDGLLLFTDHHMSPEFSTTMYNLGGRVSGLSSDEGKLAEVDLRGNLENQSPLTITGKINPLRDNLFLDLSIKFSDIELSHLSPYSGTFLGYLVDKGKLFLDLNYHIENKKLDSTNKVFLDQFTFGKKVESDRATNLPVSLAVALLKDRKGEIHLDLPVTGRTDDPKFSVWGVVLQILKNLLVKAATSPFALLQSAFGGSEDFSAVHFAAGSARLSEGEKEKIRTLGKALNDRPSLKIEVTGFVDRERDPEGYRNELLTRKMKNEKFLVLVKEKKGLEGVSADSVTIQPEEYSAYLKAVYKKEKFPKPRNMVGFVKDIPDAEMKKLILANTVVGDENLKALARERATAVRSALVGEGKLPTERIFEKSGDIYKKPATEGGVRSRVEFGVVTQ